MTVAGQADRAQCADLILRHQPGIERLHLLDKAVRYAVDHDQAFFGNTGQVVVKGCTTDNVLGGFNQIRRFIHQTRGITGPGANHQQVVVIVCRLAVGGVQPMQGEAPLQALEQHRHQPEQGQRHHQAGGEDIAGAGEVGKLAARQHVD